MSQSYDNDKPSFDFHHQHKDANQQKFVDAFHEQVVNCPGVKRLAAQCPYLANKRVLCPFVNKLLSSTEARTEANGSGGVIFAP